MAVLDFSLGDSGEQDDLLDGNQAQAVFFIDECQFEGGLLIEDQLGEGGRREFAEMLDQYQSAYGKDSCTCLLADVVDDEVGALGHSQVVIGGTECHQGNPLASVGRHLLGLLPGVADEEQEGIVDGQDRPPACIGAWEGLGHDMVTAAAVMSSALSLLCRRYLETEDCWKSMMGYWCRYMPMWLIFGYMSLSFTTSYSCCFALWSSYSSNRSKA